MKLKQISGQKGFTITELIIVITFLGILLPAMYTFFDGAMNSYVKLQDDGLAFSELSGDSQRIANILRGAVGIKSTASNLYYNPNSLEVYAYFSPDDTIASLVKIYLTDEDTKLKVDVTPRTANYPAGTEITDPDQIRHYTIINNFYMAKNLFEFYDQNNNKINMTTSTDMNTVKNIKVNLAVKPSISGNVTEMSTMVNLRNRKTD